LSSCGNKALFCLEDRQHSPPSDALASLLFSALQRQQGARINRIVVATGPGQFRGVRTGIATGRALAMALKIPAVGVTCFEALTADIVAAFPENKKFGLVFGSKARPLWAIIEPSRMTSAVSASTPPWSEVRDWFGPLVPETAQFTRPSIKSFAIRGGQKNPTARPTAFYGAPPKVTPGAHRPLTRLARSYEDMTVGAQNKGF
jgi:hypothetical protein